MENKININGEKYNIVDADEKMTVPDCFVKTNKIGGGHGEAKFYIGDEGKELRDFFGKKGFNNKCFLSKKDLLKYMEDVKNEYLSPSQPYKNKDDLPKLWDKRYEYINSLNDIIYFNIEEQTQITPPRIYVKSNDKAYNIIREISLPNITYLSALKLEAKDGKIIYYFRLFVDYFDEYEHPLVIEKEEAKIKKENINIEEKEQLSKARRGQGKYRLRLLEECPLCPITLVTDDRLLIASHIKPRVKSDINEKTDPKNGFMFTPTFDFLFDRGFISFTDDGKMLVSPWLSKMTCSKLNIIPNKKYINLPIMGREKYLDFHRNEVFKGIS